MSLHGPVLNPRRLGHVNLFVSSLEKARQFYSATCGFNEIFAEPAISAAFMSNGNTHHDLGLIEVSKVDRIDRDGKVLIAASQRGSVPSLNHLGFEMDTEKQLVGAYQALKARNVKVSRTVDHGLAHSVYMPDPDGNMLEFYADVIDDWRSFWKDSIGKTVTGAWQPKLAGADPQPHYPSTFEPDVNPTAPVRSLRVACATIATRQMQKMVEFYVDVVGLKPLPGTDARQAILAGTTGEPALRLIEAKDPDAAGFADMGIEVQDMHALRGAKTYLRSKGYPIESEGGAREEFLTRDPDGFGVRFFVTNEPAH